MTYKPDYDIDKVSDGMTPTGFTSRTLATMENTEQAKVATTQDYWIIAKRINFEGDSQAKLEALGFTAFSSQDDLFYRCTPPDGWQKDTQGYWTSMRDANGVERISMFYKGAFYDRDAFIYFSKVKEEASE